VGPAKAGHYDRTPEDFLNYSQESLQIDVTPRSGNLDAPMLFRSAALIVLVVAMRLSAHHDPRPAYNERESRTIDGSVVSVTLRNPHSFMQVAVKAPRRGETHYRIEWSGIDDLRRAGISADTFRSGDRVVITGQPGLGTSDRRLRVTRLTRPKDGLVWAQPMTY